MTRLRCRRRSSPDARRGERWLERGRRRRRAPRGRGPLGDRGWSTAPSTPSAPAPRIRWCRTSAPPGRSRSGSATATATSSPRAAGPRPGSCRRRGGPASTTSTRRPGSPRCSPAATRSIRPRRCCCGRGSTRTRAGRRRPATGSAPRRRRSRTAGRAGAELRKQLRSCRSASSVSWPVRDRGRPARGAGRRRRRRTSRPASASRTAPGDGAECIVLPEFFTTGIGFVPSSRTRRSPPDGEATELLSGARAPSRRAGRRVLPLPRRGRRGAQRLPARRPRRRDRRPPRQGPADDVGERASTSAATTTA